jgi:hypothetical protein
MTDVDVPFDTSGSMSLLQVSTHSEEVHVIIWMDVEEGGLAQTVSQLVRVHVDHQRYPRFLFSFAHHIKRKPAGWWTIKIFCHRVIFPCVGAFLFLPSNLSPSEATLALTLRLRLNGGRAWGVLRKCAFWESWRFASIILTMEIWTQKFVYGM